MYTCQAEVADLEVAVFVDEDVGGLEIAVDDAGGVYIFQAALFGISMLVVLLELLLIIPKSGKGSTG